MRCTTEGVVGWRKSESPGSKVERRAFEIDVDAVEAVVRHDAAYGGDEILSGIGSVKRHVDAAAAERYEHLPALALQVGDVRFELGGIKTGWSVELERALRGVLFRRGEGHDDDVPLGRDVLQRAPPRIRSRPRSR